MNSSNRRVFMMQVAVGTSALAAGGMALAQAKVDENDAQAKGVGYVSDASKADKAKRKDANAHCGNCALFQGKASDAYGGCGIFPGKQVANKGWCTAWAKKA